MLKFVSHIIICQMARKLFFSNRHLAAILDLVKIAARAFTWVHPEYVSIHLN